MRGAPLGFVTSVALAGCGGAVRWTPPGGAVAIHHATLYGFRGDHASGPVSCELQPEGTALVHVYTPGAAALALPAGVALELPPDTAGLAVEVHALRLADGADDTSFVELLLTDAKRRAPNAPVASRATIEAHVPPGLPHREHRNGDGTDRRNRFRRHRRVLLSGAAELLRGAASRSRRALAHGAIDPREPVERESERKERRWGLRRSEGSFAIARATTAATPPARPSTAPASL